jgi:glycerate kinase
VACRQPPLYFPRQGRKLAVLDSTTGKRTTVDVRLPGAAAVNEMFTISPDNRTIYYGAARAEADIWIVERK